MKDLSPPLQRRSQRHPRCDLEGNERAASDAITFTELTIQDIVRTQANSSAGSFYARFKGKRALLHFLHEELAESSLEGASARLHRQRPNSRR